MSDGMDSKGLKGQMALPAAGSRALVVGLGATGLSVARFLDGLGVEVAVTDSRDRPPQLEALGAEVPNAALFPGGFPDHPLHAPDWVVVSPGVSIELPFIQNAVARGARLVGDIELFARAVAAPVIAITGSNGKSTVTTLVGNMARRGGIDVAVGGNIGTPVLDLLEQPGVELYVLELSSFQLETTVSLKAAAATVLNLSPDHLDRYPDYAAYCAAKARIFSGNGIMVLNRDDRHVAQLACAGRDIRWFGLDEPAEGQWGVRYIDGAAWISHGSQAQMAVAGLKIAGQHNIANALAALALGDALNISRAAMLAELRAFTGLPHRMQWVACDNEVTWFNDSKATNVGATVAALSGLPSRAVLIAGGDCKGADLSQLAPAIEHSVRAVILLGRDAERLEAALGGYAELYRVDDLDEAVATAGALAQPGDCVLLSPACASLDMFRNYEERGEQFVRAVREWLQ